jgi:hypothetical protein
MHTVTRNFLEGLKRAHFVCDDPWYSCPLSDEGCIDDQAQGCTCGAEQHNAKIDALLNDDTSSTIKLVKAVLDLPQTASIKLVKTCWACPEQYDAFLNEKRIGYLRLRHGHFTVECPDVGGTLVYNASPNGDGEFCEEERDYYLRFAVAAILRYARDPESFKLMDAPDVKYEIVLDESP